MISNEYNGFTQEDLDREVVDPTPYTVFDALGRNQKVKRAGAETHWTPELLKEYQMCKDNVEYFARKYVKIITLDFGKQKIQPYPYQIKMWNQFINNRFNIVLACRQSGKSIGYVVFILHQIIFHEDYKIALLANKGATSRQILARVIMALENLPFFLQPGVKTLNKGSIEFVTESTVYAASTSKDAIRGDSINMVILDEFAFVDNDTEFMTSTYPVISSGNTTKIIVVSTANGIGNQFYNIWEGSQKGTNKYTGLKVDWWDVPGRDQAWKEMTIANTSAEQFAQEFGNEFIGAAGTLISANTIINMSRSIPAYKFDDGAMKVYNKPEENHKYIMTVDVSKGRGKDYSTFNIVDISTNPYKQVATYRDNNISPLLLPAVIAKWAKIYNQCLVIIEANDQGFLVCSTLIYDLEYENVFVEGRSKNSLGVDMTKKVKAIGCSNFKDLVEQKRLEIVDENTIFEMSTFVQKGNSYEASNNNHDDLVMNFVLFAWFVATDFFTQYDEDAKKLFDFLYEETMLDVDNSVPPIGYFSERFNKPDEEYEFEEIADRFFNQSRMRRRFNSNNYNAMGVLAGF